MRAIYILDSLEIGLQSEKEVAVTGGNGEAMAVKLRQGRLEIECAPLPKYVTLKKPSQTLR